MLLSVVIPVCNERHTLGTILGVVARTLPDISKEIIVVDDCSKDGTREWLQANFPDGARSVDAGGKTVLRINTDRVRAPMKIGISSDSGQLGVGVERVVIRELDTAEQR